MSKNLVIVESPAKAKTIEKYLGNDFTVLSSIGHIRSIAKKTKDGTPPIDVQNDFKTVYEIDSEKKKIIAELRKAAKAAETVWLATDEDREGEGIAWHLCEVLKLDPKKTKRIVFHEITKDAIQHAVQNPRTVDMSLVEAQQARQILDRIVGFELSPVVWQKVPGGKSAGRVQSPAVRLLVEREREITAFVASSQYKITGLMRHGSGDIKVELPERFASETSAHDFLATLDGTMHIVSDIITSPSTRNPAAPFTTSTLQQDANSKLGFGSKATMASAQKLYQDGKITYMRTDSLNLSKQAIAAAVSYIEQTYGKNYVQVRTYKTKSAGAQEAHEAIRPTNMAISGIELGSKFSEYDQKLYDLIRNRTLASQMAPAKLEKTTITIQTSPRPAGTTAHFEAKGEVVIFPGFLKVYGGGKDDTLLPPLQQGDKLDLISAEGRQTFARPPARYTEGSLVKKLEELGIGRPSTYATIINTIQTRGYVVRGESEGTERDVIVLSYNPKGQKASFSESTLASPNSSGRQPESAKPEGEAGFPADSVDGAESSRRAPTSDEEKLASGTLIRTTVTEKTGADRGKLVPTPAGELIADFLANHFTQVVDYGFTARVEKDFDDIAENKLAKSAMLSAFYTPFHKLVEESGAIDRSTVGSSREIGIDPKSKQPIIARFGRFGPMLQLGQTVEGGEKPKFAPMPSGAKIETVTLEQALTAFELPRLVGQTDDGKDIKSNIGRFGPYIQIDKLFVSIKPLDPHDITLDEAKELYAAKLKAEAEKNIADFGDDIKVLNGRYGPYITDGTKNAKIPKDTDPKSITHEQAKQILAEAPASKKRFPRKK